MSDSPAFVDGRPRRRCVLRSVVAAVAVLVLAMAGSAGSVAFAAGSEWNVARVGAPVGTASDVVIAVVDTGVDGGHPAFADRVLPQLDFTGDRQTGDPQGHGTHVAGTAAGGTLDCGGGPSAIGVAPDARILPIRVLDAEGSGRVSDVVAGIRAAADRGATVINLSLGGDLSFLDGGGNDFRQAIRYAWSKGSIPVLAAGNSGLLGGVFGSGYGDLDAVVVTATTNRDRKAGYASSVGSARWGISAPGGDASGRQGDDVLSAYPGDRCAVLGGTSMAAPHVSGALAVLRSHGLGPREAIDRLLATAAPIGDSGVYGAGLVDLAAASRSLGAAAPISDAGAGAGPTTTAAVVAPSGGATSRPVPTSAPPTTAAPDDAPTDSTPAPDSAPATSELSPRTTTEAAVPGADEVAAGVGSTGDGDADPGGVLVAVAVAACAATAVSAARLRRLVQP